MCGIAGYIGPTPPSDARIETCKSLMRRRGPDGQRHRRHRTPDGRDVVLVHSRLSILDLDPRSDQPFTCGAGDLVFNGELYDYREHRDRLERDGVRMVASGDTEVLARLLQRDGWQALADCEGMWALAWYDGASGELLLARDRFGEKPLFFHRSMDGGLYFGSEPKFVFALLGRGLAPDTSQLRRLLVNGYKSLHKTGATFFVGLERLAAGTVLRCGPEGQVVQHPYWTPAFGPQDPEMSFEEAVRGARERLIRAVELRLRADVPVAFLLSGGVDSNALIAIAKRELGHDVHGFTIMNEDGRYEEADLVLRSVEELELRHTAVPVPKRGFLEGLGELVRYHDGPVLTINSYMSWRLTESVASDGYRVLISGIGADELFSGYYDHHNAYLAHVAAKYPEELGAAVAAWRKTAGSFVRNPYLSDPSYFIERPLARDHIFLDADEFAAMLTDPFHEPFTESILTDDLLRNRMGNELLVEAVPVVLHEDDLNAMYHSVENRCPYLDTSVLSWTSRIPTRHLVRNGLAKAVLRESVRGIAPDAVLDSPRKVGFNAPIGDLVDLEAPDVIEALLADGPVFDLVRREAIARLLESGPPTEPQSKFLFNFLSVRAFLSEHAR